MAGQQPQAEQNQKPDVTANVPNEVLCLVFSHISSFTDKFRLAAVNKRFRECVIKEMKKPVPLDVKMIRRGCHLFYASELRCQLNDIIIDRTLDHLTSESGSWPDVLGWKMNRRFDSVVQALAGACKFSKITIDIGRINQEHMYRLFELLGQTDCLNQVITFEATSVHGIYGRSIYRSGAFAKALIRCDKLSVLKLRTRINYDHDFSLALKNKHLTELVLKLEDYTHQQVIELFQSLKPNTLRKLRLRYDRDPLVFPELVKQLGSAWTTVEELRFHDKSCYNGFLARLPLPELRQTFESLASFPSLRSCYLKWCQLGLGPDFTATLTSLFNLSGAGKSLTLELNPDETDRKRGCWFVGVTRQVQEHHPALQIELNLSDLKLVLGALSIIMPMTYGLTECRNVACVPCKRFYPNIIMRLLKKTATLAGGHLENYQLDRCKVSKVVDDCNNPEYRLSYMIRAIQANEEQDQVTVTFEFAAKGQPQQQHITINTGHCFDNSCIRCVQID